MPWLNRNLSETWEILCKKGLVQTGKQLSVFSIRDCNFEMSVLKMSYKIYLKLEIF